MADYYWAAEPPEQSRELIGRLNDKTSKFLSRFRSTEYARRIIRNYRYYYGRFYDSRSDSLDMELRQLGEQGEYVGLSINHFRSLIQHLLILTTQGDVAWDTKAINSDPESLQQARIGNNVLDYYRETKGAAEAADRATEHALILSAGYVETVWNPEAGEPQSGNPETGQWTSYQGDVAYETPSILDVIFDLNVREWPRDVQWVRIRKRKLIWDVVSLYPEKADEILQWRGNKAEEEEVATFDRDDDDEGDWIDVWEFWHLPTPAMPQGRFLMSVGDVSLIDTPIPYPWLPIDRVVAGEQILTPLGYTPAFDLQAPQEAYNAEASTIGTNHKSFGVLNVWLPSGTNLRERQLDGGLNVIFSDTQPVPLNLLATSPELLANKKDLGMEMQALSGVNSVARGQPEASLKSGTALALIDAKAMQSASILIKNRVKLWEGIGTKTLKLLGIFGGESKRVLAVAGKANRAFMDSFRASDLTKIDRVVVQSGNPLMKTTSGRMEIAKEVKPWIRTPEEYINLITTGQIETLLEADQNMLSHIREENSMLLDGKTLVASAMDNHVLHVREHHGILSSWKTRQDPNISANVLGHIREHVIHLKMPGTQEILTILGFPVPPVMTLPPEASAALQGQPGGQAKGRPLANPEGNPEARPEAQAAAPREPKPPAIPQQAA